MRISYGGTKANSKENSVSSVLVNLSGKIYQNISLLCCVIWLHVAREINGFNASN